MELLREILLMIIITGILFGLAYIIDNYFRRKIEDERNAQKRSIIVGLITSIPTVLLYCLFRIIFFADLDQKGLPENFPIRNGYVYALFIIGSPFVLYFLLLVMSRKYLFK